MIEKIKLILRNFLFGIYMRFSSLMIRISMAMYNTENEFLSTLGENLKNKLTIRKEHINPVLQKMLQGERDEQYVKDYYEILKKADKFLRHATEEKIEMAVNKYGLTYGKKDKWGRRYEHYGFYDYKHRNHGMTLDEAMKKEVNERVTTDDDYQILYMFDNKPIDDGLTRLDHLKKDENGNFILDDKGNPIAMNELEKSNVKRFPLKVTRKNDNVVNKIEQITSFLHVKMIGEDYRQLEFFIDKKFKLFDHLNDDLIFHELIDIDSVWINDEYGEKYGFNVQNYEKYFDYDQIFDVLKFKAIIIKNLNK